jgi:transposase
MTTKRHALSDGQWQKIEWHFPSNGKRGGQWKDHRLMVDGILWILATGAPWRDLPERFGPWKTVYDRFWKWNRSGFWQQILESLQVQFHANGQIDWDLFCIDGSVVRAHKAAAGARKKGGPQMSLRTML